ncbi:tRNA uridine-5-carboxymethylaminomethyl(34) synthesis GTPase MnmE [Aquamicrobium sp. LC103]|uniref:tRNA uridine-5-carboxymethylaminomethyl(34) synthesis GTPase MnmE n=1 Tax=Aquamicrobium sp. LC103 TaxID=1120658 RepID=UPI00063ECA0F|nr:tRNA uridine-5-carboxymethylaminomethyl(34) synthesis GTPase MnmE [Aquamicrobium sp. LC103]TKT82810.1 tRNA uridine-5-carboxymethylaminomethyl(34) synthesis GTPase MnmE [Aquamicrobium sp. LC103]
MAATFPDTIFALSSGRLPAGVAVIRLSGPHASSVVASLTGGTPPLRQMAYRAIKDAQGGALDNGLVVFFEGPASFTGEDCAEIHLHGGKAIVAAVLNRLASLPGLRQAEAGEFTRRAFMNGKMDLTGAEAIGDLILAETEAQRRLALSNAEGRQERLYGTWRMRLIEARALIEADIDFADEADVPGSVSDAVWTDVKGLANEIRRHLGGYHAAEIIRDGFRVVLVGTPNAGKSSLINALARRDVAIVTEEAGTTRDLVEVSLDIDGLKVILTDTAGLRETESAVERIGIERALQAARGADLVLRLFDLTDSDTKRNGEFLDAPAIGVGTKLDLVGGPPADDPKMLRVSSRTGEGLERLIQLIGARAAEAAEKAAEVVPTHLRQQRLLLDCLTHLDRAVEGVALPLELRAEEMRLAADALGRITGRVDVEDLLDVVFSKFCIGK